MANNIFRVEDLIAQNAHINELKFENTGDTSFFISKGDSDLIISKYNLNEYGVPNPLDNIATINSNGEINLNTKLSLIGGEDNQLELSNNNQSWRLNNSIIGTIYFYDKNNNKFPFSIESGAENNSFRITSAGNVGIGTAFPGKKLHVEGDAIIGGSVRVGTAESPNSGRPFAYIDAKRDVTTNTLLLDSDDYVQIRRNITTTKDITAHFNNNGNVGIETITPQTKLHVDGEITSSNLGTGGGNFRMVQGNYGAFWRNDGSNLYLLLTDSGNQYGGWNGLRPFTTSLTTADVTFGASIATTKLNVQSTTNQIAIRTGDAGTNTININVPTIAANCTYTLPDVGANASFVMTTGAQTIGGTKTFTSTIGGSINGNAETVTDGVYTTGAQTIGGIKTFTSNIAIGGDASNNVSFYNRKAIGVGANSYANYTNAEVQSTVTTAAYGYRTSLSTQNTSFTLSNLHHYTADQNTLGASSTVTNQFGFAAQSTLVGATNNYGFHSNIGAATGRWAFYGNGTAESRFNGNVGLGLDPTFRLHLSSDSAAKPTSSTWTISSDERLKENIELADLDICYNAVKNIPLKRYTWKNEFYSDEQIKDRSKIGWIAQDVKSVFPKAVGIHKFIYNEVKNEEGEVISQEAIDDCLSLNSDQIYATLYGAVQKLMNTVENLQTRIEQLENK
jgi:hypothetical protein